MIKKPEAPIRVISKRSAVRPYLEAGYHVIDATSHALKTPYACITPTQAHDLSPFYLKTDRQFYFIQKEGGVILENAWQYSKLYAEHVPGNGNAWLYSTPMPDTIHMECPLPDGSTYSFTAKQVIPTMQHIEYRMKGMQQDRACRFPMGRGAKPLCSLYYEEATNRYYAMDYIESRLALYAPMYAEAVRNTCTFETLTDMLKNGRKIAIADFDGYDHIEAGKSLTDVILDKKHICGHGFILAWELEKAMRE